MAIVVLASIIIFEALEHRRRTKTDATTDFESNDLSWQTKAIWLGLAGVVAGVLPVVITSRYVQFENFSHYALPASLATAVLIIGLVFSIRTHLTRLCVFLALVGSAVLTQHAISTKTLIEEETINEFWWQVTWRAPKISQGTTLLVYYPSFSYGEDMDVVTGPANFIYGLDATEQLSVKYRLSALPLTNDTVLNILVGKLQTARSYRTYTMDLNYNNILVISQPSEGSCAHLLDGNWPRLSSKDPAEIILAAPESQVHNVIVDEEPVRPSEYLFGPEPTHGWCYYYEKAELAFQTGNWNEVVDLEEESARSGLHPYDQVEWVPFLLAHATLGDEQRVVSIATRLVDNAFLRTQVCSAYRKMHALGIPFTSHMQDLLYNSFCD